MTQLLAVFFGPEADARTAVGSAVIDLTPGPVKEWAIQTFGTADKLVLSVLVLAVIALVAALTATLGDAPCPDRQRGDRPGRGRRMCGGTVAHRRDGGDIVPTVIGTACGGGVLRLLTSGPVHRRIRRTG